MKLVSVAKEQRISTSQHKALQNVSQKFESLFVSQMIEAMRKTVPETGYLSGGQTEKIFRAMLDQEYAEKISQTGQLGLSRMIYEHLLQQRVR